MNYKLRDYDARRKDDEYEVNYEWYKNKMQPALKNQVTMEKTPRYFIVNRAPRSGDCYKLYSVQLVVVFFFLLSEKKTF